MKMKPEKSGGKHSSVIQKTSMSSKSGWTAYWRNSIKQYKKWLMNMKKNNDMSASTRAFLLNEIRTNRDLLEEIKNNQRKLIEDDARRDRLGKWLRIGVYGAVLLSMMAFFNTA